MMTLEPPRRLPAAADPWEGVGVSRGALMRFLRSARRVVGLGGEVDVLLAGDATLRRLNREYRGKNKATDVLSFPAAAEIAAQHAGDLAISLETAARQGAAFGHSVDIEVRVLMLHGLLHLAGMDHETDAGEMAAREAALRKRLRLPAGLIARASGQRTAGSGQRVGLEKQILSEEDNKKSKSNDGRARKKQIVSKEDNKKGKSKGKRGLPSGMETKRGAEKQERLPVKSSARLRRPA